MSEAAKIQIEIDRRQDQVRRLSGQAQGANSQYILGAVGALLGLLLLVFTGVWWLGLLLLLAGALAVFSQGSRKRKAEREIAELEAQIERYRRELSRALED